MSDRTLPARITLLKTRPSFPPNVPEPVRHMIAREISTLLIPSKSLAQRYIRIENPAINKLDR